VEAKQVEALVAEAKGGRYGRSKIKLIEDEKVLPLFSSKSLFFSKKKKNSSIIHLIQKLHKEKFLHSCSSKPSSIFQKTSSNEKKIQ